ncbi:MAG: hypothetical protein ACR2O6_01730 [Ilumatobacteraceae bacterium]
MSDEQRHPGEVIVLTDVAGTVVFVLTASIAAINFSTAAQWVGAITAISLFGIGVVAFLWAFYNAVQRSRVEQISVTQLFLLLGDSIPARVRRTMLSLLFVQCLTATVTAFARPNTADGSPGSSLAVGFLVPMFGLGMNGLWGAYHGRFSPRDDRPPPVEVVAGDEGGHDVRTSTVPIDKNDEHG